MIFNPPLQKDYDFDGKISVDTQNIGFSADEIEKLSGPQKAIPGAKGIKGQVQKFWKKNRETPPEMRELGSVFGYQSRPLLTDLIQVAKIQGTKLDGSIIALSKNYNFFVMRCGVYILPNSKEKFEALKFKVSFENDEVSTYSMLPGPQSKKILEMGGTAEIGVNGKANFGFPDIAVDTALVDVSAKAKLEADFIVSFHYELKTRLVDAFGTGTSFCEWMMYEGESLRNDVIFYPIIMAPKTVTNFTCRFEGYFKIDHPNWKNPEFYLKEPKLVGMKALIN